NLIFNLLDSLPVDNRCNDKIWKERNPSPSVSFSQAMQFLFEWSKARGFNDNETQPVRTNGSNTCTWKKSDHNFVKLNLDVAIFKQQYVHGAGIIQWLKLGLLESCQSILCNFPNSRVTLIRRQANQVAYTIARTSRLDASNNIF
ncbi:hypothetical protein D0Y65_041120, partial [Glycine soja]